MMTWQSLVADFAIKGFLQTLVCKPRFFPLFCLKLILLLIYIVYGLKTVKQLALIYIPLHMLNVEHLKDYLKDVSENLE